MTSLGSIASEESSAARECDFSWSLSTVFSKLLDRFTFFCSEFFEPYSGFFDEDGS